MRHMNYIEYVKTFCDNKFLVFCDKVQDFPRTFEQAAYCNITTWYDAEHDIMIEEIDYIGD